MKKIFYTIFLFTAILSCKNNEKSDPSTNTDYEKKIVFYRDLAIKSIDTSEYDFSKFSLKAQEKLSRRIYDVTYFNSDNLNDTIYIDGNRTSTIQKQLILVDSLYTTKADYSDELYNLFFDNNSRHYMTVEGVDGNIVTLTDSPGGTGASTYYEKYLIAGDNVTLLSIPDTEMTKVEKIVKQKIKNYSHISGRSDMEITQKPDRGYQVKISALTDEDGEVSPSIKITFDTKDFKTVDLNSVKAENL